MSAWRRHPDFWIAAVLAVVVAGRLYGTQLVETTRTLGDAALAALAASARGVEPSAQLGLVTQPVGQRMQVAHLQGPSCEATHCERRVFVLHGGCGGHDGW